MFSTQPSTKFGLLAFGECSGRIDAPLDLGDGISGHPTFPLDLPEHWQRWLGEVRTKTLVDAKLLIGIEEPSLAPTDDLDEETSSLDERLSGMWRGLLLQGVPSYWDALMVFGGVDGEGALTVKRVATLTKAHRHPYAPALEIDAEVLRTARRFADALHDISAPKPDFRRVRAGLRALFAGIEEPQAMERLHQFVRAIDGLMMIPPRKGRYKFAERGETFVSGTDLQNVLVELYNLRNAQEHLNDFHTVITEPTQEGFDGEFSRRAWQAEQAALASYRRLLTGAHLLDHFRSETTIEAFWQQLQAQRQTVWGQPFDLDAAAEAHDDYFRLLYGRK